jgi:protein-tyrosine phosphatase
VAGPRARHPDTKLDLCYVTPQLIVTSGPAISYPSRAYRNPLPRLVAFIESRHGKTGWRIFEFRAEGTGYSDAEVGGQIEHFPWPDHHPPPFSVLPHVMVAMEKWLGDVRMEGNAEVEAEEVGKKNSGPVAVLHCQAGKGRSGTVACSYLISVQGWEPEKALERFKQRRMRPGWGDGVSIKSQRRWIGYVNRWRNDGRRYEEVIDGRRVRARVMEVRIWGMRDNTRVAIRGFTDGGKKIENFHEWSEHDAETLPLDEDDPTLRGWLIKAEESPPLSGTSTPKSGISSTNNGRNGHNGHQGTKSTQNPKSPSSISSGVMSGSYLANPPPATLSIFRPTKAIVLPSLDVNIEVEKRNRNFTSMVTSTAHSWFNTYFEGNGPENNGKPETSGIYTIEWDAMDGLKGSSKRGVRAVEKVAVVWKIVGEDEAAEADKERREEEEEKTVSEKAKEKLQEEEEKEVNKKLEDDSDSDAEGVQAYGVEGEKV